MDEERKKLREKAEAATPGPWLKQQWKGSDVAAVLSGHPEPAGTHVCESYAADASFIAAANPKTVLALLAEIERLLSVAYAASYFVNTKNGITQLYDAVRDREYRTDFANYRTREVRIEQQSHKIGNLEADVKELREQLAAEIDRSHRYVKALDEACDLYDQATRHSGQQDPVRTQTIAELRKVGAP